LAKKTALVVGISGSLFFIGW
jgi:hypothetical protein